MKMIKALNVYIIFNAFTALFDCFFRNSSIKDASVFFMSDTSFDDYFMLNCEERLHYICSWNISHMI